MKSLESADLNGKRVILRVDYNVSFINGKIEDTQRIIETIPTIEYLLSKKASIIIISHLGRPDEERGKDPSLAVVAETLEKLISRPVKFTPDIIGEKAQKAANALRPGQVMMLENLRTNPGEEKNDNEFAKKIASLGNIFVQDAFANAHRNHASMVAITQFLPSYPGLLFQKEYENLNQLLKTPKKPFVVISAGKKIETKLSLLKEILKKADIVIIGGGIANTFAVAEGYDVGKSFYEENYVAEAEEITRLAEDRGVELLIPDDVIVAKKIDAGAKTESKFLEEVAKDEIIVDIGPQTIAKYREPIMFAGTIFWNGPMGIAEYDNFAGGTKAIASLVSESQASSVVGGGDTIAALKTRKMPSNFDFISTGGGAALEFLAGKKMPALEALGEGGNVEEKKNSNC